MIQTKGAIGYVEYAYAKENKMTSVSMINKDGKVVKPDAAAFQAAAAHADWAHSDDYYVILTDEPGPDSWPIAGATFILMYKQPPNVNDSAAALKFFDWAYTNGGKMAEDLDYVPLPKNVVAQHQEDCGRRRSRVPTASPSTRRQSKSFRQIVGASADAPMCPSPAFPAMPAQPT